MSKKLIIKIIILLLPFIIFISYINYNIDSNFIFHSNSEKVYKEIAKKLNNGISVYIPDNYENRNLQQELYRQIKNVDIVVIGASRGRQINQSLFEEKIINSCFSAGTLEDVIASSGMIFKLGVNPKRVIIESSPYLFNENIDGTKWQLNEEFYDYMMDNLYNKKGNYFFNNYKVELFKELFSVEYLKINMNTNKIKNKEEDGVKNEDYILKDVIDFKLKDIENSLIMPDGVILFKNYVNGLTNTKESIEYSTYRSNSFRDDFIVLSSKNQKKFEDLVNYYQAQNIEVILFLAPYSPYAYDVYVDKYPPYIEAEEYLLNFANEKNIKVIGSYSPHKYELYDRWDFHDYAHPSRRTVEKIFHKEYKE